MYRDRVYLDSSGRYYQGNTHQHTVLSDGRLTPAEVVRRYRARGYDFLAWSEHDLYVADRSFDSPEFITLGGCERGHLNPYPENDNPGFHLCCIEDAGCKEVKPRYQDRQPVPPPERWEGFQTVTACIRDMEERGNLVVLNHPEWHMTPFNWILENEYFAVEIYNHATERSTVSSYGTAYWDHALQHGKRLYAIAADDVHGYEDDHASCDYGGGFIVVQAEALERKAIAASLRTGRYYASSGPRIEALWVEGDRLHVRCSECRLVVFKSWPQRSELVMNSHDNKPVTQASQPLGAYMKYIRVECIDFAGQVAWSNPVFLDDLR